MTNASCRASSSVSLRLLYLIFVRHGGWSGGTKGRIPYRRHRLEVATFLGVDESYIWPDALGRDEVAVVSDSEVVAVYPRYSAAYRSGDGAGSFLVASRGGTGEQRDEPLVDVPEPGVGEVVA